MASRRFLESDKSYKIALVAAGIILLFVFIITYSQIVILGKVGVSVSISTENYLLSEKLQENYQNLDMFLKDSSQLLNENKKKLWNIQLKENKDIHQILSQEFKNHTVKLTQLKKIKDGEQELLKLIDTYKVLPSENTILSPTKTTKNELLEKLSELKELVFNLRQEQKNQLDAEIENLDRQSRLTPIIFSTATFISLVIMLFAFYKIYRDKNYLKKTTGFLESILNSTEAIASLYTPVYNKNNEIIDFEIEYASALNELVTSYDYSQLKGRLVSEAMGNTSLGNMADMITSFTSNEKTNEVVKTQIDDKTRYFRRRFFPSETDLRVIFTDITESVEQSEEIKIINEDFAIKNEVLGEAEKMAKLGSYIWHMDEDYTILSDNAYRIMGYKPQEFESSSEKFREFTHPEDLELYDKHILAAFTDYKPVEFMFRIITKQGKIKHIYTNGAFSKKNGKTIMIGILQDVSKRAKNEIKLQEQNIELIRRNAELDSFNRMASHDLQEPLRKVQMYLSRIEESETENLSDTGINYFQRVHDSATRMRSLINNLLAFSRIDRKDFKFEKVDLNVILIDVKDEFSLKIEETKATIISEELPIVNGIHFQLEQLFLNLIGNALKFKSDSIAPKIEITASKIHHRQISEDFTKTHTYYYVIKIIDNGIGFSQKNNDKIFELFQRLHEKHEYSGTGIGLAICKKIVQKHHGHIHATSVKNEGSAFIIYLPSGKLKMVPKNI